MALYKTQGIRGSKATIANHGEKSEIFWSGSESTAAAYARELKAEGFDVTTTKFECPKDKAALIDLLNEASNER